MGGVELTSLGNYGHDLGNGGSGGQREGEGVSIRRDYLQHH